MSEDFHISVKPSERHANAAGLAEGEALKVVLVDQSRDAEEEARDRADARLDQELGEGGKFKQFVNGIWKGNIAKEFYRQRYIHDELKDFNTLDTLHSNEDWIRRGNALDATIARFTSEHEELIHTNAGERREVRADEDQLAVGVKQLIRKFAQGRLDEISLYEERVRLFNEYRKEHGQEAAGKGIVMADNLLQIAQAVAGAVEHAESMDNVVARRNEMIDDILGRVQVVTGEARNGARTEVNYSATDKIVDKLTKSKVGSLVQPSTIAVVAAAAGSIARVGGQGVVGNVARAIVPGAVAGLWAGLRENKRTKDERTQHAREMATGGKFEETDKRRVEMEKARYETIAAVDLITHLNGLSSEERLNEGGNDALQAALDALAAIQARVDVSDSKKVDLISYSSKAEVGEERMMLDLARRHARLSVDARLTEEARAALNIGARVELSGLITQRASLMSQELIEGEDGLSEKDKVFAKLKARRVTKAVALGTGVGIVGGLLVQEVVASMDTSRFGLIDAIRGDEAQIHDDGLVHQTTLESMFRGDETIIHTDASSTYESYETAPNGSVELTDDHTLVTNEDGSIDIKDGNGELAVEGLVVDANGTFDQASLDKLEAAGMVIEDHSFDEEIVTTTEEVVSAQQFIANHAAETTNVTRDLWYGNNSNVPDGNELKVFRGGSEDTPGLLPDGSFQYTIAGMDPNGSWQGGDSVNWTEAAESGNLFVAVSGTYDTQGNPFMLPIGPDGNVTIPADSPAAKFFANEDNSVAFNGAYMEIVQTAGVDEDGTVHIRPLATVVGDASVSEVTDTVTTVGTEHHAAYTITTDGYDTAQGNFTEMAPITPVVSRRSMEALQTPETEPVVEPRAEPAAEPKAEALAAVTPEVAAVAEAPSTPENGYGSGDIVEADLQRWQQELSPRLRENPEAELQTAEELDFYYEQQLQKRGQEYIDEIEGRIDASETLKALGKESRAIVVMPVGAAQEADNIYATLALYAKQDAEAQKKTTLLLNVNWIDETAADPAMKVNIDKTLAEIERARADFPDLNIASFTKVWQGDWVRNIRNKAMYGEVIKTLYDTAAFAVRRGIKDGRVAPEQDLLLVTNDADARGMHQHYLQNYIKAEETYKDSDAFTGTIRWGVDAAEKFPGYHVSQLFMQTMNIVASRPNNDLNPTTIGPNSAFRVSTYAAIGGCEDTDRTGVGADSILGKRVVAARGGKAVQRSGGTGYGYGANLTQGKERIIRQVVGSDIDSAPERLLDNGYRKDRFIPRAWDRFDEGDTRTASTGSDNLLPPEDPQNNFAPIQSRVEKQITGFINEWYADAGAASFALSMLFPDVPGMRDKNQGTDVDTSNGNRIAQAWKLEKQADGKYKFQFTGDGARQFRNSLLRHSPTKGQFDSISNRLKRRVYGETRQGARRLPVAAEAPLVRA